MTNVEYTSDRVNVVHGRWDEIRDYTQAGLISFECSECGRLCDTLYRYCPHCGAKMGEDVAGKIAPDLVNVVRCKDCKFWKDQSETPKWLPCCEIQTDGNWYCADGERREDE